MNLAARWSVSLAAFVATGIAAGLVHAVWHVAAANRADPFLEGVGLCGAAFVAGIGLASVLGFLGSSKRRTP